MRAVLLRPRVGPSVEEVPEPVPSKGELVVELIACGLCGTDVERIRGGYTAGKAVLGHEAVGRVVEVGEGAEWLRSGEVVVPHHHTNCGECYYCLNGSPTMCPEYRRHHFDPGGFAEKFRVPEFIVRRGAVYKVRGLRDPEEACLTEPLACCIRAVKRASVREGQTVAVFGVGAIGALFVALLRCLGVEVLGVDVNPNRLGIAERLGARAVDARQGSVEQEVRALTGGRGADVSIVATGSVRAVSSAISSTRSGGVVCLFGLPSSGTKLDHDFSELLVREVSLVSSNAASEEEMVEALDLISRGKVRGSELITHRFSIGEFGRALEAFEKGEGVKIVITP
ncbi:MAG: alcohol dehydrogenase catalytic domain-containing protein [Nitrososphaerota archaeon]